MKQNWYQKTIEQVLINQGTSTDGLSEKEAALRLRSAGPNSLPEVKPPTNLRIFFNQFKSPLVYILLFVSVTVLLLGDYLDGGVIAFVLFFNAIIGTIQEGRANNTMAALKRFTQTKALVVRDGAEVLIPDTELVLGDVVILHEGNRIPADGRLIEVVGATVDEASLTGESNPIAKTVDIVAEEAGLPELNPADQINMVFKGTSLVAGSARFVVTATGVNTEIGRLSQTVMEVDTEIPLQKNIRHLTHLIIAGVIVVCLVLLAIGVAQGIPVLEMIKTVVAISVSLIPEGLPIVLTLILANGVWRMSQRKALVKKLAAVEALGHANVIAVDKTGTITRNELIVKQLHVNGKNFLISGRGYEPNGDVSYAGKVIAPGDSPELLLAGRFAAFAQSELVFEPEQKIWLVSGDPTEAALLVFAEKLGFAKDAMLSQHRVVQELPFNYKTKYRAVVFEEHHHHTLVVTGAPEAVAALAGRHHEEFDEAMKEMAGLGLRIIAFGFAKVDGVVDPDHMPKLQFGGLYGLQDTLHREVPQAVADVKSAGMKVVMITGDWPETAKAIAKSAGIYNEGDHVLTGADLAALSDNELAAKLPDTSVFARITPENKLRIVEGYQSLGLVIAMTGDGVNDVPPLVAADLGIAMGRTGTEVTKESADIVLLDDNFTTIAAAVEEGRNIYKTIRRAILYLASTSMGELFAIVGALLVGWPLPVTAVQILWLNFVTDGFLTVSFAAEPKEGNLLREPYRKPSKYIIDSVVVRRMIPMGLIMAIGTLWLFSYYKDGDLLKAHTIGLTVLAVYQWYNAFNCRSETRSVARSLFTNHWLWGAMAIVITLQLLAVYWSPLQKILGTTALTGHEWLVILALAATVLVWEEGVKLVRRVLVYRKGDSNP
jgi:P-type Ca2+ transporter type 2C